MWAMVTGLELRVFVEHDINIMLAARTDSLFDRLAVYLPTTFFDASDIALFA
jgi:hypothetical protein